MSTQPKKTRKTLLFKEFAELWFDEKKIEWRNSHVLSVRNSIDASAEPVIDALSTLTNDKVSLSFTLLHGQKQAGSNVKRVCMPHWRKGLKLSKKLVFNTALANSDAKAGEFGWLGVNLVNTETGKAIEGLRYAFAIMYVLECELNSN